MTEFSGFVLENSIDRGWQTFERWLATVLSGLVDGDVLVIARESGEGEPGRDRQPHIQFCAWGDGLIRAEAASNRHLHRIFALSDRQSDELVNLGYRAPLSPAEALAEGGSTNFNIDQPRTSAAELARRSVRTLREVYGIVHPAFLTFSGDIHAEYDDIDEVVTPLPPIPASMVPAMPAGLPPSGTLAKDWQLAEAGPIAMPESPQHLRQLIEDALLPLLGRRPLVDEDGDFVVPVAGALVFVRVVESAPVVAVFSQLVESTEAESTGLRDIQDLNATVEMVKFFEVDGHVVAGATLAANPFVGAHLRQSLSLVARVANDFDEPADRSYHGPAYGA
jgi:hypothetical protein